MYKLTIGKNLQGTHKHDWYSGQLEHMAKYGDANEAKRHLRGGNPEGAMEWPEVYDQDGNRMKLDGRRLVRA
jgi:hypothetical protein